MSAWVHEVKQPLTAICNYASASKTLLSESLRLSVPISEDDAHRIIHWMEEISGQTTRILKLAEEQSKIWEEQSHKQEFKRGSGTTTDSPKFTS